MESCSTGFPAAPLVHAELLLQFLAGAPVLVRAEGDRELLNRLPELFPLGRSA